MKPSFIVDEGGNKKQVVIPIKIWERIVDEFENLHDELAGFNFNASKSKDLISFEEAEKRLFPNGRRLSASSS